eukprot:CAMPEP_0119267440 /NCGR_PEP_ID=MMETSP1329-20130426/5578_1 /TAXON_ID=114041 /ORGANISM="Genus nov. species nov., Strain RCC1024" /LENGTH=424 /DNA_ID=CAMNT_0007267365 /DNA_START=166 /DNA_END=1437 /DNA_ORIENTATION=+
MARVPFVVALGAASLVGAWLFLESLDARGRSSTRGWSAFAFAALAFAPASVTAALVLAVASVHIDVAALELSDVRTPALVVYKSVLERNAARMRSRAEALGCSLRVHCKTIKTLEGAVIATAGTKRGITVSTLAEAEFYEAGGFDDMIYAIPLSFDKIPAVEALAERLDAFHVLVDHPQQVRLLGARRGAAFSMQVEPLASRPEGAPRISVYVGVDCGYHRDGVDPNDPASLALVKRIDECGALSFAGLYTHGGHSYDCQSIDEVRAVAAQERDEIVAFAEKCRAAGVAVPSVGVGSTPTCSNPPAHLEGVDEMHPGNFMYYDLVQTRLGSCAVEDVAPRVLTRVVGNYPHSNTLLIDCGWTGASAQGAGTGYGCIPDHPHLVIASLKQECGEVTTRDGDPIDFSRYPVGTLLEIAPHHSCAST